MNHDGCLSEGRAPVVETSDENELEAFTLKPIEDLMSAARKYHNTCAFLDSMIRLHAAHKISFTNIVFKHQPIHVKATHNNNNSAKIRDNPNRLGRIEILTNYKFAFTHHMRGARIHCFLHITVFVSPECRRPA